MKSLTTDDFQFSLKSIDELPLLFLSAGATLILMGIFYRVYKSQLNINNGYAAGMLLKLFFRSLDKVTSIYPLCMLKDRLKDNPVFIMMDRTKISAVSSLVSAAVILSGFILLAVLYRTEALWYVKLLVTVMSFFLPWYVAFLILDVYKYHVEKQIPHMIDEFRSAFVKHQKIKPALLESCSYIDKSLGRIICRTADGVFIEKSLDTLKVRINNVWFNIFVILLSNYKQNGGELIDQLYRLNRTMSRYVNMEKKRAKRLIWYEIFAVVIAAFSIPSIMWLNRTIVGGLNFVSNPASNFIMARLICFSIISLLIVRVLRRL